MVIKWYLRPTKSEGTSKYEPNFFCLCRDTSWEKTKKMPIFLGCVGLFVYFCPRNVKRQNIWNKTLNHKYETVNILNLCFICLY